MPFTSLVTDAPSMGLKSHPAGLIRRQSPTSQGMNALAMVAILVMMAAKAS